MSSVGEESPSGRTEGEGQSQGIDLSKWEGKSYGEILLYCREALFEMIYRARDLRCLMTYFLVRSIIFSAVYGLCLGVFALNLQIVSSALKVPVLLLGTIAICLPALSTFNVLLGSKLRIRQTLAVLVVCNYLLSLVLVSLAPILLFFIVSTPDKEFILLLNVACFVISGGFGLGLLWSGMKYLTGRSGVEYNPSIIRVWSVIYMFVGTQLSWLLRPFIGQSGEFAMFRDIEGNFYVAVFRTMVNMLR